jgi:hypothetical protein
MRLLPARIRASSRRVRITAAFCLVLVVAIGGASALAPSLLSKPAPSAVAVASATPLATPKPTPTPLTSPTATPSKPASADVALALASKASWVAYASTTLRFSIAHPASWVTSETVAPGWAVISSGSNSDLEITWRSVPAKTTLSQILDEYWKTMHDSGYTVVGNTTGAVGKFPAKLLTVDGPAAKPRHGNVALIVTTTGRYRIELWTVPGSDASAATLFSELLATFQVH